MARLLALVAEPLAPRPRGQIPSVDVGRASEAPNRAADRDTQNYVEKEKQQSAVEASRKPKPPWGRIAHL